MHFFSPVGLALMLVLVALFVLLLRPRSARPKLGVVAEDGRSSSCRCLDEDLLLDDSLDFESLLTRSDFLLGGSSCLEKRVLIFSAVAGSFGSVLRNVHCTEADTAGLLCHFLNFYVPNLIP